MAWDDKRIETWVGVMLRTGVMLAAAVVLTGGILYLARHGYAPRNDYSRFHGEPPQFTSLSGVVRGAKTLEPRSIIMLGLLILIATPVARVVMCIVGFLMERDRLYVAVSSVVLVILLYSVFFHH
jgi:uncharacterized membrane protein